MKSIIDSLREDSIKNINIFDAILIDAGENRAKITRYLVDSNFKGIIFFDNSDNYRNSIGTLTRNGYIEIPFFGLKPITDYLDCTSILMRPSMVKTFLDADWVSLPKLRKEMSSNLWDDESI